MPVPSPDEHHQETAEDARAVPASSSTFANRDTNSSADTFPATAGEAPGAAGKVPSVDSAVLHAGSAAARDAAERLGCPCGLPAKLTRRLEFLGRATRDEPSSTPTAAPSVRIRFIPAPKYGPDFIESR
jgi:hypothetical protein